MDVQRRRTPTEPWTPDGRTSEFTQHITNVTEYFYSAAVLFPVSLLCSTSQRTWSRGVTGPGTDGHFGPHYELRTIPWTLSALSLSVRLRSGSSCWVCAQREKHLQQNLRPDNLLHPPNRAYTLTSQYISEQPQNFNQRNTHCCSLEEETSLSVLSFIFRHRETELLHSDSQARSVSRTSWSCRDILSLLIRSRLFSLPG